MRDPFELIEPYFRAAAALRGREDLAAPADMRRILQVLPPLVAGLGLFRLTGAQRKAVAGTNCVGQREASEALFGFLGRQPGLALRTGIDLAAFRAVIDKDESYDILIYTVDRVRRHLKDARLQCAAWVSERTAAVIEYVRRRIATPGTPAEERAELRLLFGAADLQAAEQEAKDQERAQRNDRKQRATAPEGPK